MTRSPEQRTGAGADDAVAPAQLSARDWRELVRRAGSHLMEARLPYLSAGVAFFAVLSVAPLLVTALSVYGALNTPAQARSQLAQMAQVLPPQVQALVTDQLTSITTASTEVLTVRGVVGLVLALWTATTAAVALIDALTVAYHETETRGFLRRTLLGLLFVLGGALLLGAVIALAGVISRATDDAPGYVRAAVAVLAWPALAVLMSTMLAFLYRFAPDRRDAQWRWTTWGAVGATLLWAGTSAALFAYVQNLGTYGTTYGSLAGVAISMFWLWLTVLLIVFGAVVNGESERQTLRDSTTGPERPLGERGAVVADSTPADLDRP
ncbi:YihY/virulence factor BrkB family protein [Nocardioides ochotonae]|uniref:YihY/virulence factor BrkB family protein n=1 Tax=Nocardioides ochotonae TaxID=2685869 RepID=UPI001CD802DA|nr:YihY/virulence factor BrkB family protein [Nocardioides ochotonae]